MSREKGQNLVEFSIIIALVAIVCIFVLSMLGVNINSLFNTSYNKVDNFQPFGVGYDKDTGARAYKAGELGGTSSAPKSVCQSGTCVVDYGDFILTGIPENYGDFIESSGASGGTDSLCDLIKQIGEQINDTNPANGNQAEDFKLIANMGYYISDLQQFIEKGSKSCTGSADPRTCFTDLHSNFDFSEVPMPDNIKDKLTNFKCGPTTNYGDFIGYCSNLGFAAHTKVKGGFDPTNRPSEAILQAYDRIIASKSSDGVTPQMQKIATTLLNQMSTIGNNMYNSYLSFRLDGSPSGSYDSYDINGVWHKQTFYPNDDISSIYSPETSKGTDLRSDIYCATGNFKPDGSACK